ncbi:ribonuclease J [Defluviitalea raffinosedens]|uniref:Ribonuclease J n=1 Tax=Defluviitalea raffinosedens TaxID=1450156 RepID=A0A7C8LJU2_9FIRM|nr:ribonuclease J [Defluviitalea raffinosedens]KAE9637262.1 RNase J family beta-CASP ribonuclease [Defluviitalea raffinosedens]MBM7685564.1 ribonuclease J [Defluviitalea raffinosedens]MBZ4669550.1 RNase family beta-CASP ribonuclease [Defluviitaleaceae bacterium]
MAAKRSKLKIIPLGGLGEIGKNITAFEYNENIIVVDCGLAFPEDEMLGIDLVIPDITYLKKNAEKVKGIILTHGHEDHIGALPYFLKELNVPIYGTKLTIGLVENKLKEHNLLRTVKRHCVSTGETIDLDPFKIEFIRTNHSISDAVALAIHTPVGVVIHSGDFKVDYTPIKGNAIDLQRFAVLGSKGVLALLADSTNAERKGYTMSERTVGNALEEIFAEVGNHRIMVATFASNVDRVQQIINAAYKHDRKVAVIGRSMVNVVKTASELGYLDIPENTLIDLSEIKKYNDDQIVIIMTGSQGEPMAALSRIATSDHRQLEIKPGDKIILSSSPIPGNEKTVSKVINELFRKGADVIYEDAHVSGHACQEELKLLHSLVKPKYFIPVHGEYRHLKHHAELAMMLGMPKENIHILSNGDVLELTKDSARVTGTVPSGQILVDGLGVGDVGNIVLRDRRHLSQDGLLVVVVTIDKASNTVISGPDIISRGFVYVRESEDLMDEARNVVKQSLNQCEQKQITEWSQIKSLIKDTLKDFLWQQTKRSPMILPIIMEV